MSADLFIQREDGISKDDFLQATERIHRDHDFLEFIKLGENNSYNCHFWKAIKCVADLTEDGKVHLSANSNFAPYTEFVAYFLASQLGCTVYDPQKSTYVDLDNLDHDIESLKKDNDDAVKNTGASTKLVYKSNEVAAPIKTYYSHYEKGLTESFPGETVVKNELTEASKGLSFKVLSGDKMILMVNGLIGFNKEEDSPRTTFVTLFDKSQKEPAKKFVDYLSTSLGLIFTEEESY